MGEWYLHISLPPFVERGFERMSKISTMLWTRIRRAHIVSMTRRRGRRRRRRRGIFEQCAFVQTHTYTWRVVSTEVVSGFTIAYQWLDEKTTFNSESLTPRALHSSSFTFPLSSLAASSLSSLVKSNEATGKVVCSMLIVLCISSYPDFHVSSIFEPSISAFSSPATTTTTATPATTSSSSSFTSTLWICFVSNANHCRCTSEQCIMAI